MDDLRKISGGSAPQSGDNHSNMSPLNPHKNPVTVSGCGGNAEKKRNFENFEFWCGIDWLTCNFQICFMEWDKLHEKLEMYSAVAMEEKKEVMCADLDGALMAPGGASIGKGAGKRGKYCKYRMRMPWGAVLIAEDQKYKGSWPNVQVSIPGEVCLTYRGGAIEAFGDAVKWIESLSVSVDSEKISRVDFCADFPGYRMRPLKTAFFALKWRCRAKRRGHDESNGITLNFGSNPLLLRIYDKLREIEAKYLQGEPIKFEHMVQKRWGGVVPDSAIRVEYQVSRPKLKQWGVDSFEDLMKEAPNILGYLTGYDAEKRWFRFLKKTRDAKHPERDETSDFWRTVQRVFISRFGLPEKIKDIDPDNADTEVLCKQGFGVLEAAAWNGGFEIPEREIIETTKYKFRFYEDFERWFCGMLRNVAANKQCWKFKSDKAVGKFADEIQWMKDKEFRRLDNHVAVDREVNRLRDQVERLQDEIKKLRGE
jgi:hypothetical protein